MKLATLILAGLLGATGVARADDPVGDEDLNPPSGPVQIEHARQPMGPMAPGPGQQMRDPRRAQLRAELRQALIERFDRNHDGRLEPQERRQAIRALRRLVRRMARQEMMAERRGQRQRLIRRYDTDGDGNLGPGELPPRLQEKLRHFDRNADGWLDDADL
jgi:Ca2+-binding EF-hand superfamily protein